MKTLTILGSTGSIGRNVLEVVSNFPEKFKIVGLTSNRNVDVLIEQIHRFNPEVVGIRGRKEAEELKRKFPSLKVEAGEEGIEEVAKQKVDLVIVAIVGIAGLKPTLSAVKKGNDIALANKEILVAGGKVFMEEVKRAGINLFPLDSEHCAIFQILDKFPQSDVKKVIITASGGPFYHLSPEKLCTITVEEALKHPVWKMGKKITIDSATLMNKGFEVITAHWLFDIEWDKIEVVIHPEAIVHAMVEMIDGTTLAFIAPPDMKIPIQYVLTYPEKVSSPFHFTLTGFNKLSFFPPDERKFPALRLTREVGEKGGTYPAVLNASNEVVVEAFLAGEIKFPSIWEICEEVVSKHKSVLNPGWREIFQADSWAREVTSKIVENYEKAFSSG